MACNYRRMTYKDIPTVLEMSGEFFEQSNMRVICDWDPTYVGAILEALMESPDFFGLIAEEDNTIVGMITAIKTPSTFFNGNMACEQVWYVKPEYRSKPYVGLKLFNKCWSWAIETNCKVYTAGAAEGVSRVDSIYERLGFIKVDSTWMKRL